MGGRALTWVGHSTVRLELGGTCLLTDPVLVPRIAHIRRIAPPPPASVTEGVDAVLITHAHLDHLDLPSLRTFAAGLPVLAPRGCTALLRRRTALDVVPVRAGTSVTVGTVEVRVVPAAHDGRRLPVGPARPAVGYLAGGVAVYGDTDVFDGMREVAAAVDVAVLPVWGWGPRVGPGHLDPERAAQAVARLRPRIAVPVHWGTLASPRVWWRADPGAPARRFAERVARLAPGVDVHVLEPGGRLTLG